jgi:ubiquitin-conjugating enzyme E2 J2
MANDMCTRRLTRELKAIQNSPLTNPNVYTTPLETNILEWHYVIEGSSDTPYHGGYYWGKLIFPKQYPLKPPSVIMLTPNGRFKTNRRLCLSMSDFHPESWNPMWSVSTIITGLISFMVESGTTLGSIESTTLKKKQLARQSLADNVKDATFCKLFPELVQLHKQNLLKREQERIRLGLTGTANTEEIDNATAVATNDNDGGDLQGFMAIGAGFVALLSLLFAMRFL